MPDTDPLAQPRNEFQTLIREYSEALDTIKAHLDRLAEYYDRNFGEEGAVTQQAQQAQGVNVTDNPVEGDAPDTDQESDDEESSESSEDSEESDDTTNSRLAPS